MDLLENKLGTLFHFEKIQIFFGNKLSNTPDMQKEFPNLIFQKVKQVHGDKIVPTTINSDPLREADAHYTQEKNLALSIFTADCTPAFIFNSEQNIMAGVHAGWRGMAQEIIPKTIRHLMKEKSIPIQDIHIVFGPHIQQNSFEIKMDCLSQLLKTIPKEFHSELYTKKNSEHYLFDLNKLLKVQLSQLKVPADQIHGLFIDTFTSSQYHSYRRDAAQAGRQLSWGAILR